MVFASIKFNFHGLRLLMQSPKFILPLLVSVFPVLAKPVLPKAKGDLYSFSMAGVYFEVDAGLGARISSLKLGGTQFMYVDHKALNWGSTFWPSPQATWFWPPPETLDSGRYTGGIKGAAVELTSGLDKRTGYVFTKRFHADDGDTSVTIEYGIRNAGAKEQSVAPWAITRVLPGGLAFWPKGQGADTGMLAPLLKEAGGALWFDYAGVKVPDEDAQAYGDGGAGGWLAHASAKGLLLIKKFRDVPPEAQPKGEREIELYTDPKKNYMEIEHQGPMVTLKPGESTAWEVKWYLRRIPPGARKKVGDEKLLKFVESVVAGAAGRDK
jgi:hypothetical protein